MPTISRKASRLYPCSGALGTAWQKINSKAQMFSRQTRGEQGIFWSHFRAGSETFSNEQVQRLRSAGRDWNGVAAAGQKASAVPAAAASTISVNSSIFIALSS